MDKWQLRAALDCWREELTDAATPDGHWSGRLAPSALSTATAVSALSALLIDVCGRGDNRHAATLASLPPLVRRGVAYLRGAQNTDGGFGDTDRSRSNIATTLLVLAAWRLAAQALTDAPCDAADDAFADCDDAAAVARAEAYVQASGSWAGLRARYGRDKTFVVPILTNCAIAGMVPWSQVPRLPFESAVFPQSMYRFLQMPVVSYAIPALVAIGQARHFLGPPAAFPVRLVRRSAIGRTMRVLQRMQPHSGGYLEATPLTSFVLMSLAATGRGNCDVAGHCSRFLVDSAGADGSWPIDTNLATWVTSLAVHALQSDPDDQAEWASDRLIRWLLECQHTERHPFTGADPGGWGWTDLSGAVPDGDDTPAAILALDGLRRKRREDPRQPCEDQRQATQSREQEAQSQAEQAVLTRRIDQAIARGQHWLLGLQNRDGGWPTFCRGWGKLPFDRSSVDLTAHALRALHVDAGTADHGPDVQRRVEVATAAGWRYLLRQQRDDGSWLPLWFGNQDLADDANPVYGTGRVLLAMGCLAPGEGAIEPSAARGAAFLLSCQNPDGGWGGGTTLTEWLRRQGLVADDPELGVPIRSSVEETAVAVEGLAVWLAAVRTRAGAGGPPAGSAAGRGVRDGQDCVVGGEAALQAAILRGVRFLDRAIRTDRRRVAWPIGFYFAKLWYHERLYPAVFATAALAQAFTLFSEEQIGDTASRVGEVGD